MTTITFIHVRVPIFIRIPIIERDRVVEGGIGLWRAVVGCEGRLKVLKDGGGLWRVGEDFFLPI